ncbi:Surfeit locus protein 1 [Halotydeus destructor]|nr:Surfeit locus protein 1 [Halotydeus destructor]
MLIKLIGRNLVRTLRRNRFTDAQDPTTRILGRAPAKRPKNMPWHGYVTLLIPGSAYAVFAYAMDTQEGLEAWRRETGALGHLEPVDLPVDFSELEALELKRVKVRGRFDHSREMYILPKILKSGLEEGTTYKSKILDFISRSKVSKIYHGAWVITPFKLSDRNEWILVNRGWVPTNQLNPDKRLDGQVEGEQSIIGHVRKSERSQNWILPDNNISSNYWKTRDIAMMAKKLNTSPVFLDQDLSTSVVGGPVGGQTKIELNAAQDITENGALSFLILMLSTLYIWWNFYIGII